MRPLICYFKPIIYVILVMFSTGAYATGAKLFINPQKVIFEKNTRFSEATITNLGDKTGVYEIEIIDVAMTEEGGLHRFSSDAENTSWSIKPYVRYSPRRVTLGPKESQVIKISLRNQTEAENKEYFSHLKVRTLNDNLEKTLSEDKEKKKDIVEIKAHIGFSIPIIWKNTTEQSNVEIKINTLSQNALNISAHRYGEVSTRGYLHVYEKTGDNYKSLLENAVPLIIYTNLNRRNINVELSASLKTDSRLEVFYTKDPDSLDTIYAKTQLDLGRK